MLPRWLTILLLLSSVLLSSSTFQQGGVSFDDIAVFYTYGEQINFQAFVRSDQLPEKATLYLHPKQSETQVFEIPLTAEGNILYSIDLEKYPLRPFAIIDYWFKVEVQNTTFTSETNQFLYEDNRLQWKTNQDDRFIVHWIDGDEKFGQKILNTTQNAFEGLSSSLPIEPDLPLHVYVFPTAAELQSALNITTTEWVAGHTDPDLSVILVSIANTTTSSVEFERQIPHEMAHIFLYQWTGSSYSQLPPWLTEGFASQSELYPNVDYARAIELAASSNSLLSFNSLCQGFPRDASGAFLAYAQSTSFVDYIINAYGNSGLQNLLTQYRDGKGCEEGVQAALGNSLDQIQMRWQQEELNMDAGSAVWEKIRPYALVCLLILLPPLFLGLISRLRHG